MDDLVRGPVMIIWTDGLHHVRDRVLGQQHPTEDALLRGHVVGRGPIEALPPGSDFGHAHRLSPPRGSERPWPPPIRWPHPVVVARYDSLVAPRRDVQSSCAQVCGQPVQTRRRRCAQPGDTAGDDGTARPSPTVTACGYAIHRMCAEKTLAAIFRGRSALSYPHTEGDVKREIQCYGTHRHLAPAAPGRRAPRRRAPVRGTRRGSLPQTPGDHDNRSPRIRA